MNTRRSKLASEDEALAGLRSGQLLAIGGSLFHNKPMSLVRAIARKGLRDLVVVATPQASIDVDLLIGAGCVAEVRVPYLGFEYLGLAANYRRLAAQGNLRVWDCDETHLIAGLEAAAKNLPSALTKTGVGSDLTKSNTDLRVVADPITGEPMVAVPAIEPDLTIIHAARGDKWGNLGYAGYGFADLLLAEATNRRGGRLVASVDEVVPAFEFEKDPFATGVPHILVDAVVEAPWGAWPCSSHGHYQYDEVALKAYLDAGRAGETTMRAWLDEHVVPPLSHTEYLDRFVTPSRLAALRKLIHVD